MSDDPDRLNPADEQDMQAAEYVMGALSPVQARALEALALHDDGVRASISAWELRLAPLAELIEPQNPPPVLWRRLALAAGIDNVVQMPVRQGQERQVLWKAATAVSLAIAASLAFLLVARPQVAPEPLMAALSPLNTPGATFLVRVAGDGTATVVAVGDTNVPPGRSLELWAVAAGATAPVSLGLLPPSGSAHLTIPVQPGTQLLVSQEQAGGSPTKAPTTTPIYGGKLTGI